MTHAPSATTTAATNGASASIAKQSATLAENLPTTTGTRTNSPRRMRTYAKDGFYEFDLNGRGERGGVLEMSMSTATGNEREPWEVHRDNYNTHQIVPCEFEFCVNCRAVECELLDYSCEVFKALHVEL